MKKGKVKFFNGAKGFGFITDNDDNTDVFVHASALKGGQNLNENDLVEFDVEQGKKGLNAVNIKVTQKA